VIADYGNYRNYKIFDIDFSKTPKSQTNFGYDSYIAYYEKGYKIKIKNQNQPLLIYTKEIKNPQLGTKTIRTIYLIPELCKICGIDDSMKNDRNFMQNLA
jgi:aubergine-like protein